LGKGKLVLNKFHFTPGSGYIDQTSTVGADTKVWQFASVIRGSVVGGACNVASCSIIDGAQVGDRCLIGHGAQLHPGTKIGNDVFVGPGAIFCNDVWPRCSKDGFEIGDKWTVIVEDGAVIGAGAVILPGSRIGAGSMVAAGAVCDCSLSAGILLQRNGYSTFMPAGKNRMRFAS
jgi:UDP-2-acetamido-3-amino-2,3-dideoxy-glucuronate N-acetyltransferase